MLPGVELARRRRVHYHGDVAAGEHHHHQPRGGAGGLTGPALAARTRLEEKLRGAGPPSTSRWTGLMRSRDGRRRGHSQEPQQQQQEREHQVPSSSSTTSTEHWPPPPPPTNSSSVVEALPKAVVVVELCAVCLDEVREERVTRLPCSHQYHSDCVLPWLAIQPDCPCCRTLVPQLHTMS